MQQITSVQNSLVKHFAKLCKSRVYRQTSQSVLIEGKKLVHEVSTTHRLKNVFVISEELLPAQFEEAYLVNSSVIEKVSGVQAPEGIVAEVEMPKDADFKKVGRLLVLDGVSDPGNMGTLLRTALALGWQGAFLLNECCDPYNDKALRAAKGATFRFPIAKGSWERLEKIATENRLTSYVADLNGEDVREIKEHNNILLVLSHEGRGASQNTREKCQPLTIPMQGEMESLNVGIAGGILMFLLKG